MKSIFSGERILNNVVGVIRNAEVMVFLTLIMFAGTFWGFIEAFLFWYLDDLGASHFLMGWTVAVGMITSLPFLVNIKINSRTFSMLPNIVLCMKQM